MTNGIGIPCSDNHAVSEEALHIFLHTCQGRLNNVVPDSIHDETSMEVVLLGDQLGECQHLLKQVVTIKDNIILNSLLDRVASTIHQEISRDPYRTYSKQIPGFGTTKELVERYYASNQPNPALESAFLCLAQLSHFVW